MKNKVKNITKILIAITYLVVVNIGFTKAFYTDNATSVSNTFGATSLDFELRNTDDTPLDSPFLYVTNMMPGDSHSGSFKVVKTGELDFEYNISTEHLIGHMGLYNTLDATLSVDGSIVYTGNLSSMSLVPMPVITDGEDIIDITVSLPSGASSSVELAKLGFELVVRGDQLGPVSGFWDEERTRIDASTLEWTPPVISNIMVASPADPNGLKIMWNTDEESDSYVEFGTTTSYEIGQFDSLGDLDHVVDLTSVISLNTDYHFRVVATDVFGNTAFSDDYEFNVHLDWFEFVPRGNIVINEVLPDPIGADDAMRPGGEWVELYNKGGDSVDVAGWTICNFGDCVTITSAVTDTGGTVITSGGFLVIYFEDLYTGGLLGNSGWNLITLNRPGWLGLRDLHMYYGSQEGKSIVRYPDGGDLWFDPVPTPGAPNTLKEVNSDTEEDE
jgi:hypothetical protein